MRRSQVGIPFWAHAILAAVFMLVSGAVFHHLEPKLRGTGTGPVRLPVPLGDFPLTVGDWEGQALTIPATTEAYMRRNFADDFVSRRYVDRQRRVWADLYVVYCASRPSGILGHRPRVCYPNAGWVHDGTESSEITTAAGRTIPCLIHRLHKPLPDYMEILVLSFYVVNGRIAINEDAFSDLAGRTANLTGDPARYVAQVQVSSVVESSIRAAAADLVDTVMTYLPNEAGRVMAAPSADPNRLDPNGVGA